MLGQCEGLYWTNSGQDHVVYLTPTLSSREPANAYISPNDMRNIHIGHIIHERFKESGLSIAEFAARINRTRGTVYDIFSRKSIDTDLLVSISEVLHYDFFQEYYTPEIQTHTPPVPIYQISLQVEGIVDAQLLCQHLSQYKKKR